MSVKIPVVCLLLVLITYVGVSAQSVAVGQTVGPVELKQLACGDGRENLDLLRGQPVMFASWISNSQSGVPVFIELIKIMEEFGNDGLISVLVDRMDWNKEDDARFVRSIGLITEPHARPWGAPELNLPFESFEDATDYLSVALVSVEGKLLIEGNIEEIRPQLEQLIKEQLKQSKEGWGSDAKEKKIRSLIYRQNDLGAAMKEVKSFRGNAKAVLEKEAQDRFEQRLAHVAVLKERGQFKEADTLFAMLEKAARADSSWRKKTSELRKSVTSSEFKKGLLYESELAKILSPVAENSFTESLVSDLETFAKECEVAPLKQRASDECLFARYIIRGKKARK